MVEDFKYVLAKGNSWNDTYVILRKPGGEVITLPASYYGLRPKTTKVLGKPGHNQLEWLYGYLGIPEELVRKIRRVVRNKETEWKKEEENND